ncbi:hypothetical protein ACP70R_001410 [Stipagrostis hirtigluma subsp. patula]
MAATATAPASSSLAVAAAAADAAPPAPPHPAIPEQYMYKNRLQQIAQRAHKKLPVYDIEMEGELHQPKFRCTVEVDGERFSSTRSYGRRKEAEQDAARVAYDTLVKRGKGDAKEVFELIDQDVVFCKSILHEFAVKTKTSQPSYSVAPLEKPMTLFVASVVFDGKTYTGEAAVSKKDAEQKAARAAVKSILDTGNTCMMEIIMSKKNFITAIASQTKTITTFAPIKFTRPVAYAAYGGSDHVIPESQHEHSSPISVQGPNIVPAADPSANASAKAVTGSKKRKGRVGGSEVEEPRVSKGH